MTAGSLAQILSPKATQLRCHLLLKRRPREATQSGNSGFRSSPARLFRWPRFARFSPLPHLPRSIATHPLRMT